MTGGVGRTELGMVVGSGRGEYVVTIVLYINYIYIYTICMFRISQRTAILIVVGSFLYKYKYFFSKQAAQKYAMILLVSSRLLLLFCYSFHSSPFFSSIKCLVSCSWKFNERNEFCGALLRCEKLWLKLRRYGVTVTYTVICSCSCGPGKAWPGWGFGVAWRDATRLSNARNPTQVNLFLYIFVCLYSIYGIYISLNVSYK